MDLLLFSLGSVGFIAALVFLIISFIRKKPKKRPLIALGICFALAVTGLFMDGENYDDEMAEEEIEEEIEEESEEIEEDDEPQEDNEEEQKKEIIEERPEKIEEEPREEIPKEENRKEEIERVIRSRISDGEYRSTNLERVTINDNMGEGGEGTYIALVYLDFGAMNRRKTANNVMRMYSDDLAATLANKGIDDVAEIVIFWTDDYNDRNVKYAYEYRDGGFYLIDIAGE